MLVGTNVRIGRDEIDIVARKADLLVVCEVRTRKAGAVVSGFESIGAAKRRTIVRAASALWRKLGQSDASIQRFRIDVAAVTLEADGPTVSYAEGAMTAEDA